MSEEINFLQWMMVANMFGVLVVLASFFHVNKKML